MRETFLLTSVILTFSSCQNEESSKSSEQPNNKVQNIDQVAKDTIIISQRHKPNAIFCDLDGDNLSDTVKIVQNTRNVKYGLKVIFGNKKVEYLGAGKDVLGQGFDDMEWIGIFKKAPKGGVYWNNVEGGEIISGEDVKKLTRSSC